MLLLCLNWLISIIFVFLNHPMSLGAMLLAQTILIALITGHFCLNFWFSYILFLIMIGGMLVMFMYMTSVASNEKFNLSINLILFSTIMMIIILLVTLTMDYFYPNIMSSLFNNMQFNLMNKDLNLTLNKLYNYPNFQMIIFLMNYLLITLIAVVKIVGKFTGTLRQK
uniref:NADH-ubiquinone oxidoreductase chain 6 n=1 Tax=Cryptorhynchinae sp. 7 ACP-2013 TaxID=1434468 RepID=A0A3G5FNB8_9CUCU|nr:NADH dehydrogenase subunit 6 [Cryptorhynchinae sp. 7 ACP-2013]